MVGRAGGRRSVSGGGSIVGKHAKRDAKAAKKAKESADDDYTSPKLKRKEYEARMAELQIELVRMQYWVKQQGLKVVLIFEGRDAAGKGGTIKRLTEPLNPRGASVVALPAPSDRERTQWYFQRYVAHLPAAGEIVILDRSWYNRGGVERVMGFCTEEEYRDWLRSTPEFERMLVRSGIVLLKYWFSVSDAEQEARFQARAVDPLKRWKLSPMDFESREKWVEFSKAKDEMFSYTDIREAPWYTIEADDKKTARLNCISHVLERIPYEDALPGPIELPERPPNTENYQRPPKDQHIVVDSRFWEHAEIGT
jgi:polyphosphate kinase